MDISSKIKSIRESKKIKQVDIANALDLDPSYYFRLEKRGDKLTLEQLEKIAGALGVSVMELITGEPQTVQNDERVKELELLVSHWKELAETRNELLKQKEKQLKGYQEILLEELLQLAFDWIKENKYGLDINTKGLTTFEQVIPKLQPQYLKKFYIEAIWHIEILNYAIAQGLLGEQGEVLKDYQLEILRALRMKRRGYDDISEGS